MFFPPSNKLLLYLIQPSCIFSICGNVLQPAAAAGDSSSDCPHFPAGLELHVFHRLSYASSCWEDAAAQEALPDMLCYGQLLHY